MNEVTHHETQAMALYSEPTAARKDYAQVLAGASLLPKAYQKQPANVFLAIEYGSALGIPPMDAITSIHVVDGKPTLSADLIAALVRRAGHKLRVTSNDERAEAVIIRADDPEWVPDPVVWTMQRAQRAGLAGKNNWRKYPAAMLRARAITEAARQWAPEALHGAGYTAEELEPDPTPVRVEVIPDTRTPAPAHAQETPPPHVPPAPPQPEEPPAEEPPVDTGEAITQNEIDQIKRLQAEYSIPNSTLTQAAAHYSAGRTKLVPEMTRAEAARLIQWAQTLKPHQPEETPPPQEPIPDPEPEPEPIEAEVIPDE